MPLRRITDDATAARLIAMLEAANADRRWGTLTTGDIVDAINDAQLAEQRFAVRSGAFGRGRHEQATLCVATAVDDGVLVGIHTATTSRLDAVTARARASESFADRVLVRLTAPAAPRTPYGDELLAQVIASPDDDEPRLVYADWLAQQGDPRGELIVVQCELAALPSDDATHAREHELLRAHRAAWVKDAVAVARDCVFRRGFITSIVASAEAFAAHGDRLLDREPVEELVLCDATPACLDVLARTPHLARLRTLRITSRARAGHGVRGVTLGKRTLPRLRALLASPHVDALRELDLMLAVPTDVAPVRDLFAGVKSRIPRLYFEPIGAEWIRGAITAAFPHAKLRV